MTSHQRNRHIAEDALNIHRENHDHTHAPLEEAHLQILANFADSAAQIADALTQIASHPDTSRDGSEVK